MKFYFLIMIFVSNFANSVNWICKAPNPMDELISAPKARVINTDEFFTTENYTHCFINLQLWDHVCSLISSLKINPLLDY